MRQAIIKTLCYSQVFNFPLTAVEIHRRLIGRSANLTQVEKTIKQSAITHQNGYYFLGKAASVASRLQKKSANQQKLAKAKGIAGFLKIFPSIQAVYVTGAVAVGNAGFDDDIDIMLITTPNSLWSTRLIVNSTLDLFGLRRRPQTINLSNKVCLNLWLTTKNLAMPKAKQNLYTAYEIIQAKLLWDRHDTHRQFLWANRWLLKFLPNTIINHPGSKIVNRESGINWFERVAYTLQQRIMKAKITIETISPNQAFFHPRDTQHIVETKYQQLCRKYL